MTPILDTSQEYPMMHVWYKFSDASLNLWWVIVQTSQISQLKKQGKSEGFDSCDWPSNSLKLD